ncbi:MAG: TraR/DksA family transcriptional regulator [Pseudobdellovibrionaceae bacterium]
MNATDLKYFKSYLLEQKGNILNKSTEFRSEQLSSKEGLTDEAEVASLDNTLSLSIQLHERDRSVLYQIERALSKLEEGSYGHCESCGDNIGVNRLKARPFASLCIQCKEEQEDPRNYLN